jgi:thioredoxin
MKQMLAGLLLAAVVTGLMCSEEDKAKAQKPSSPVSLIESTSQFDRAVESAGHRLLVIDLYADWCMPCRVLSPMLERLALEKRDRATFYKIDVDRSPMLAEKFMAQGIPLVVFVKNGTVVHSMAGLQPAEAYAEAIDRYAG